jgi:hypothetical protein
MEIDQSALNYTLKIDLSPLLWKRVYAIIGSDLSGSFNFDLD